MDTYTNPTPNPRPQDSTPGSNAPKPKDYKKIVPAVLLLLLLGTWGYIIFDKSKESTVVNTLQSDVANSDSARQAVEGEYNNALLRLDSLTGTNVELKGDLADKQKEIDNLKTQIASELKNAHGDLTKARALITELRGKVNGLMDEVAKLKEENQTLTVNNQSLTSERDTLSSKNSKLNTDLSSSKAENEHIRDEASTLHASSFNVTALNIGDNGKEKQTDKAKKANTLRFSFNLDENNITPSGNKELYVIITAPDGNIVTVPSQGSGTFTTRKEGQKTFTTKLNVDYEQGHTLPVSFNWRQDGKFQIGTYNIAIYQNGYAIGHGSKELKKSGFLGL